MSDNGGCTTSASFSRSTPSTSEVKKKPGNRVLESKPWSERLAELRACPWYWGDLSWRESESLLLHCPSGTYLVRDSRNDAYVFAVSYNNAGRVLHSRIGLQGSALRPLGTLATDPAHSVVELLDSAVKASLSGSANMLMHRRGDAAHAEELQLTEPLSRISLMPPLMYMCRLTIRSRYGVRDIKKWRGVSPKIVQYLCDPRYIIPPIDKCVQALERIYPKENEEETVVE